MPRPQRRMASSEKFWAIPTASNGSETVVAVDIVPTTVKGAITSIAVPTVEPQKHLLHRFVRPKLGDEGQLAATAACRKWGG